MAVHFKKTALAALMLATLLPAAAFAVEPPHGASPVAPAPATATAAIRPMPTDALARNRHGNTYGNGRYEMRSVQRWVEGSYRSVFVPRTCEVVRRGAYRGRATEVCRGGGYQQQWVPGHYENVQDWVWVDGGYPGNGPGRYNGNGGIVPPGYGMRS